MNNPCNMATKSQMLLRKSIQKTNIIFHKAFLNLKSFLFRGYRKLPNIPIINPSLSARNSKQKITQSKGFPGQRETSFGDQVQKRKDNGPMPPKNDTPVYEPPAMYKIQERVVKPIYGIMSSKNDSMVHDTPAMRRIQEKVEHVFDIIPPEVQKNGDAESLTNIAQQINGKITKEKRSKKENKKSRCEEAIIRRELSSRSLAKRMKELEMMDVKDVDHVMDIEEVLHHYSSLTSPVYLEIVDKFFTDMYHEYLLPQPTLSANSSMRSSSSMRRLGPVKL